MNKPLRIIVADDEQLLVEELSAYLTDLGHEVIATVATGKELVDKARKLKPTLVVTDIKMPDMDGLDAVKRIGDERPTPVVIISAFHDDDYIRRANEQCVLAYLVKPIDENSLKTSIAIANRRFQEFQALLVENNDVKQSLENRKRIERAKGILMKRSNLSESDAFGRLQELASTKHQKMVQIAASIIEADEAF